MSDETTESRSTAANTIPQESESRPPWLLIGLAAAVALLLLWWGWTTFGPRPALGPALRSYREAQFPEAERKLSAFLAYEPGHTQARLALADVQLNLDPPKLAEARKTLDAFRSNDPSEQAINEVLSGKIERMLGHPSKAEKQWKDALRTDPLVGEAGWLLLQLYYNEGRTEEARSLALRLYKREREPDDRVRLLLEPIRQDAEPLAAATIILALKKVVQDDPTDVFAALGYYRAVAKDGTGIDGALQELRKLVEQHPSDPACLDGLFYAMSLKGDYDGMRQTLATVPKEVAANRRLARYRGLLAQDRKDFRTAIAEYKTALERDPADHELLHRLADSYKLAGMVKEAEEAKVHEADVEVARLLLKKPQGSEAEETRLGLFEDAIRRPDLGRTPDLALYKQLANVRDRMGYADEAAAWYKLVLQVAPDDAESLAALERLPKPR